MSDSVATESTIDSIMEATYLALCEHGYPSTSISNIADEFEKSKSLLYYHYENKETLLEDFLAYLLDRLEAEFADTDRENPYDHLTAVVDRLLPEETNDEQVRFRRALIEIRSQAPYVETYHEQFRRSDELVLSELTGAIEDGIEQEQFRRVDPERTAEFLYSTANGAIVRGVTLEDPDVMRRTRRTLDEYVESNLLVES